VPKSALAEHLLSTKHPICIDKAKVLASADSYMKRHLREAIEIMQHSNNSNGDNDWTYEAFYYDVVKIYSGKVESSRLVHLCFTRLNTWLILLLYTECSPIWLSNPLNNFVGRRVDVADMATHHLFFGSLKFIQRGFTQSSYTMLLMSSDKEINRGNMSHFRETTQSAGFSQIQSSTLLPDAGWSMSFLIFYQKALCLMNLVTLWAYIYMYRVEDSCERLRLSSQVWGKRNSNKGTSKTIGVLYFKKRISQWIPIKVHDLEKSSNLRLDQARCLELNRGLDLIRTIPPPPIDAVPTLAVVRCNLCKSDLVPPMRAPNLLWCLSPTLVDSDTPLGHTAKVNSCRVRHKCSKHCLADFGQCRPCAVLGGSLKALIMPTHLKGIVRNILDEYTTFATSVLLSLSLDFLYFSHKISAHTLNSSKPLFRVLFGGSPPGLQISGIKAVPNNIDEYNTFATSVLLSLSLDLLYFSLKISAHALNLSKPLFRVLSGGSPPGLQISVFNAPTKDKIHVMIKNKIAALMEQQNFLFSRFVDMLEWTVQLTLSS
ncbi:hypothetical protein KI387_029478, partial [Taxus chinensis]